MTAICPIPTDLRAPGQLVRRGRHARALPPRDAEILVGDREDVAALLDEPLAPAPEAQATPPGAAAVVAAEEAACSS